MRVVRAPEPLPPALGDRSVFLAGSIGGDYRDRAIDSLRDTPAIVLDPRRDDWDATWIERDADPRFRAQTEWEIEARDRASLVAFHFAPETVASVSLIELGLSAPHRNVLVCCPTGFWCEALVAAVCERHALARVPDLDALCAALVAFARR
jgi:hypothetical protein